MSVVVVHRERVRRWGWPRWLYSYRVDGGRTVEHGTSLRGLRSHLRGAVVVETWKR